MPRATTPWPGAGVAILMVQAIWRMADAAANPCSTVAAILLAARLGVGGRLPLPPRQTGDGLTGNDAGKSVPASLALAQDDLATDTPLCVGVGQGLGNN